MLRSPLSELVPTLKRLKYKDLELEFEKEANKILAEAERDLPPLPKQEPKETRDTGIRFSRKGIKPSTKIMESWRDLEIKIRTMSGEEDRNKSTGYLIHKLEENGKLTPETSKVILNLATLRNKVAHTDEGAISYDASASFSESVSRVIASLNDKDA